MAKVLHELGREGEALEALEKADFGKAWGVTEVLKARG